MTTAFVIGNLKLGATSSKVDLRNEFDLYTEWFIKNVEDYMSIDDKILIIAGNFFNTKSTISVEDFIRAKKVFERFSGLFEDIFVLVGKQDISRTSEYSLYSMFNIGSISIVEGPNAFIDLGNSGLNVCCKNPKAGENVIAIFTDEDFNGEAEFDFINFGKTERVLYDKKKISFGNAYGTDWNSSKSPGGFATIDENGEIELIDYPRKSFQRVELTSNKISGKNPVKWITENKKMIEDTCLEVIVSEDTDKTLYSKFLGVLSTVKLADLKLTESFQEEEDLVISEQKPNYSSSVEILLKRDGAKKKIRQIFEKLETA